tara:strand:+ start:1068 stop:1274 length:207 start_codon:yes stop_codon:yes gene_type:complete
MTHWGDLDPAVFDNTKPHKTKQLEILHSLAQLWAKATANGMPEIRRAIARAEKEVKEIIEKDDVDDDY